MVNKNRVLVCLLFHILGCFALDYGDLKALGIKCDGRDSCTNLSTNFMERNCECDSLCATFGDCCIDAPWRVPYHNELLRCVPFGTTPYVGAYAISGCPRRQDPIMADCLGENLRDPLLAAPVSVPGSATTYSNVYCAACHGANLMELVPWNVLVSCQTLASYNLSSDFVWQRLERDEYDEWGVQFQGQFHVCDVLFDKPEDVTVRLCRANVVSSCQDDEQLCDSYTAVVYTTEEAYLNPHCALCNGESADQLFCDRSGLIGPRLRHFSFALLFDVNRSHGDRVGVSECPRGKTYDPFFKKCRSLFCALEGYKLVDKKCVKS